mmetsp:Transcript_107858/g.299867  ORF Transcript_107858/g.299867 Transcript_107858/m.299867 type:complete len:135 (-) Transcript_107858:252-656(-)
MTSGGAFVPAMEDWLSSEEFDAAWRECYDLACRGHGGSDRNISDSVLYQTAAAVHAHLPPGELQAMIPEPDREFVLGALEAVGAEDVREAGIKDLEHFEAAIVIVYTHLAFCAEKLQEQLPAIARTVAAGVPRF